ncbi:MAG: NADH-quinone oxidoreductase subunit H [Myxococcota bacterium]
MNAPTLLLHALGILLLPILLSGVITRTKAIWAGRKGPSLWQTAPDLLRLLRKQPVYSTATSWMFRAAPVVVLAATLLCALMVPWVPGLHGPGFEYDFVAFAYLAGLARMAMVLGALDTASSFEGMGASREATLATVAEPAFFLALGTLAAMSGHTSFQTLLVPETPTTLNVTLRVLAALALFLLLQLECGRIPVDDPTTHLELTMIHEVMILDHSGPDLAALMYAAALKLFIFAGLIAGLLNPWSWESAPLPAALASLVGIGAVAVAVGLVESLVARIRIRFIPHYGLVAVMVASGGTLVAALTRGLLP